METGTLTGDLNWDIVDAPNGPHKGGQRVDGYLNNPTYKKHSTSQSQPPIALRRNNTKKLQKDRNKYK